MIAMLLSLTLAAAPADVPAKSAVESMDAKVKAERIAKVTKSIADHEKVLKLFTPEAIANEEKTFPGSGRPRGMRAAVKEATEKLPGLHIELRWLKGELTPANTEAAVKTAEEALAKAEKDKTPTDTAKAALAKATAERDEVARLEKAEKPKDAEPN